MAGDLWTTESAGELDLPLVVLVHGSMDRSTSFAKLARDLEPWRVLRYDRRGYGRSLSAGTATTIDDHVRDLVAVLGGRQADVVVGHSIGGVIALAAAARVPGAIGAVVAYESPLAWLPWWPPDSAGGRAMAAGPEDPRACGDAAERFMRGIVGDDVWERLPAATRRDRRAEGMALVAELRAIRVGDPPPYEPGEVAVPVVAAHGSRSVAHHVRAARVLAELAPHAVLRTVEGAAHGAHRSHPHEVAELVREAYAMSRSR